MWFTANSSKGLCKFVLQEQCEYTSKDQWKLQCVSVYNARVCNKRRENL